MSYQLAKTGIIRLSDGALIPEQPLNRDWQQYLGWRENGNTPLPADGPSLSEAKAKSEAEVNQKIEQAKIQAGIAVGLPGMVAQYASNAFYVERWITGGRPAEPDPADYPTAEAERQGFSPALSLAQMLGLWEAMWAQMNAANAGIMLARRRALEGIKSASDQAGADAALAALQSDLMALRR